MRILVDLPDGQLEELEMICKKKDLSTAEAVGSAVAAFIERNRVYSPAQAFGLWRKNTEDGLEYQAWVRSEW